MLRELAAVAALAAAVTACSSGSTPPQAQVTTAIAAQPANPVVILKETGAAIPAGAVNGQRDIYGDRYASGTFGPDDCGGGCVQVDVYTYASTAAMAAGEQRNNMTQPDDGHAYIAGQLFTVAVTAYPDSNGSWSYGSANLAKIAKAVHGTVLSQ